MMDYSLGERLINRPFFWAFTLIAGVVLGAGLLLIGRLTVIALFDTGCRTKYDCLLSGGGCYTAPPPACGTCTNESHLSECDADTPCPEGQKCIQVLPACACIGYGMCITPCTPDSCPTGWHCGQPGTCEPNRCTFDSECGDGYCVNGQCSERIGHCYVPELRP